LRAAVGQVLGTMAQADGVAGELPFRPEFGSRLHLLRHRKVDALLQELARVYVIEALGRWERRVNVLRVEVFEEPVGEGTALVVRVEYRAEGSATVLSSSVQLR
jgi:phage baseplate assembly protein W